MRIAICDDLIEQIDIIKKATTEYFKAKQQPFQIDTFDQAFLFLDAQDKLPYDLVLLDIVMPGLLGTDVAKEIRMKSDKTEIIFLTTSDEFAIDAFEVNASHYLLKPLKIEVFTKAMDRVILKLINNESKMIQLKGPKGVVQTIDKDTISHIESNAHHQYIFLIDHNQIETVQTMTELFNQLSTLSKGQFVVPYKGFIVNQHMIATIESHQLILKTGVHIPIPRRTFHEIKKTYFDYMFKGGK